MTDGNWRLAIQTIGHPASGIWDPASDFRLLLETRLPPSQPGQSLLAVKPNLPLPAPGAPPRPGASSTWQERADAVAAELAARGPAPARLAWLVTRARHQAPLPPECRTDAHLVPGCLSRLWLVAEFHDGVCRFACDSDSQVVRAVAGLLCELASGLPPGEILAAPPDLPIRLGLDRLLTANRRAAQSRVWTLIQDFVRAHAATP